MRIARVFPRRTKATPDDDLVFIGPPPLIRPEIDEVRVSCTFTWDLAEAERLAESWGYLYPTELGGPATGQRGEEFTPGLYLKPGYVITSRGCPNRCWFCSVWKRDGELRELPITDGWDVLDDNLLACSEPHFLAVCEMLSLQPKHAKFTGGLEPGLLTPWHVERITRLNPETIFTAYDDPGEFDAVRSAAALLTEAFPIQRRRHHLRCYVLIGHPRDTMDAASDRLNAIWETGLTPMAMLWRDESGKRDKAWARFQRNWARPDLIPHAAAGG